LISDVYILLADFSSFKSSYFSKSLFFCGLNGDLSGEFVLFMSSCY